MAALLPFRALRPAPDAAPRVAAVPYDVVSTEEARALAAGNPLSFLHVSRAEIDLPPAAEVHAPGVYARAAANFETLKRAAPLQRDERERLYVYRLRMGSHVQTGVAGTFSVDEYDRDVIKKHERTRADKEDDRTRHMLELRAQTGPVFLTYRASAAVNAIVERTVSAAPLVDFTAPDAIQHTLWPVAGADVEALVAAFASIPALYIADGHHRAASAARTRQRLRVEAPVDAVETGPYAGPWDAFLAVAFPDDQVQVLPYNRVVADLGTHSAESLLLRLRERFTVAEGPAAPRRRGEVSMYLDGRWYVLDLGPSPDAASAADRLDVSRLQDGVLAPLLGIGDVRTDPRIDFVGGGRGTGALEARVRSGQAAVAFSMFPVGVDEMMAIADSGGIMPPKSTWFEPKLRDGLLIHVI